MGDERRERRNETYCKAIMGALKINPYIDDSVSIRVTDFELLDVSFYRTIVLRDM